MPPPKKHRNDPEPLMGAIEPTTAPARILGEEEVEEMVATREAELDLDDVLDLDDDEVT